MDYALSLALLGGIFVQQTEQALSLLGRGNVRCDNGAILQFASIERGVIIEVLTQCVSMISENTVAASSNRFVGSFSRANSGTAASVASSKYFMCVPSFCANT